MSEGNVDAVSVGRRFHLVRLLGKGGMGEVYEAVERETGVLFAVKLLRKDMIAAEGIADRFRAEAEIMMAMDHPGNVPVYGAGNTSEGLPYFVMKKVGGTTLEEWLREGEGRPANLHRINRLLEVFESVCETVACAHERGIVHRDLKPENILLDEYGAIYVLDWGIAKRLENGQSTGGGATVYGVVIGSPGYMSPEQASGDSASAGPPADVFALGVILYRMLTGINPFDQFTPHESMLSAIHWDPKSPRRVNPWVSRSLSEVCRKAIAKDPTRRYRSARELQKDLRAYKDGRRTSASRLSVLEWIMSSAKRHPTRTAIKWTIVLVVLFTALFFGVQIWIDHRLADKAYHSIEQIDAEVTTIEQEIRDHDARAAEAKPADKQRLGLERDELEYRVLLKKIEAFMLLRDVARLRFVSGSADTMTQSAARLVDAIKRSLAEGYPGLARALVSSVFEGRQRTAGRDDISDTPLGKQLRDLESEAEKMIREGASRPPARGD